MTSSLSSRYFNTQAVVLSSKVQGEFGASVVLATPDLGRLAARISGVRRSRARLKPLKEAGVWADLSFYGKPGQQKPLALLTGRVLESFWRSRTSFDRFQTLLKTLRFSEIFLVPFDPRSQEKFLLLTKTLEFLESENVQDFALRGLLSYKLKILDLSGWRFSASDLAKSSLGDKMLQLCKNLEMGLPMTAAHGIEKRLGMFVDIYTENLVGRAL